MNSPTSPVELLRFQSPFFHLQVHNMTLNASDLNVDGITLLIMSYKTSNIINLQVLCPVELLIDFKFFPRIGNKSEEHSCAHTCHVLDGYYWVLVNSSKPICAPCPFGAKCKYGKIVALPNYWGYKNKTGFVTMTRCPAGYCCENKETCLDVDSCRRNRGGILCGACLENLTESLWSSKCLPVQDCQPALVLVLYILSVMFYSICVLIVPFLKDKLISSVSRIFKKAKSKLLKRLNKDQSGSINAESNDTHSATKCMKHESEDGLKYLQILFYYVQDAILFKIHLPHENLHDEGIMVKILQFSPEAITYLYKIVSDLCYKDGTTAVTKILFKSLFGPFVMLLCLLFI